VDGILTADPRLVKEARTLEQVSYREAAEMSYFGAKVLHPKTISPAVSARIPIRIKNTFRPKLAGTVIAETSPRLPQGVKTVSSIHDLALVTIEGRGMAGVPGVARRVFEATERAEVNVIMISQGSSEQNITFVVPAADTERLVSRLEEVFALELKAGAVDRIVTHRDVAVVSIVGRGMAGTPGVSARLFGAMGGVQVNVLAIAQGSSELSISVAVKKDEARRAVRAVHSAFGLTRIVNLVVLGCGRVGETLLDQLAETHKTMEAELGLELRLVGLANSRRLLLDDGGLDPKKAIAQLGQGSPRPPDHELIKRLLDARFTDLVLVDVTAADTGALQLRALESGIHVVTANKRPLAGTLAQFESLVAAARSTGAKLTYETTFGAGLPVLHTLKELRDTGDRFLEISGCFSGTLGFLCTRLEEGEGLERAVEAARNLGLTEPDPREDLSGRDVARKALIIARSAGIAIEPDAVSLTPLIKSLDKGLDQALRSQGDAVGRLAKSASDQGKVLRYVATITPEEVKVGLRAVPKTDPIGSLQGQDNMLVYRTRRYNEHPLVIRGPGAGAEVTAAGVLGDVLKVARG
jgi:aspartokinase/homoserine dehydrogenase 1